MNERSIQILNFIEQSLEKDRRPPTIREICDEFEIASTNGARYHITLLEKAGLLKRTGKTSRGLIPTAAPKSSTRTIEFPVLGRVAAGEPILAEQSYDETIAPGEVFGDPAGLFALKVRGDSMIDAGILDGDYVVVRKAERANPSDIIVAILENEATVKYYRPHPGRVELVAANPNYAPIQVGPDSGFRIAGIVTGVIRTLGR